MVKKRELKKQGRTMLQAGYVHVYTGNGKGKTTAAIGLALRASGAGLKVFMQQFVKSGDFSEIKALRKISGIKISQCGLGAFIIGKPTVSDVECAQTGLLLARENINSRNYDLVILDEINVAMRLGLIDEKEVLDMLRDRPASVEIVLTGRGCPAAVKKCADLVTEMREIKHPHRRGIRARLGIEK